MNTICKTIYPNGDFYLEALTVDESFISVLKDIGFEYHPEIRIADKLCKKKESEPMRLKLKARNIEVVIFDERN